MRDDQVGMWLNLRHSVTQGQRVPVTEFRLNAEMETIGDRIRRIRTKKGISRKTLERETGLAYSTIADIENGNQRSSTRLHKIAQALGVTIEELEDGTMSPEPPIPGPQALTRREQMLIRKFRAATPDGKRAIEGAASGVAPGA